MLTGLRNGEGMTALHRDLHDTARLVGGERSLCLGDSRERLLYIAPGQRDVVSPLDLVVRLKSGTTLVPHGSGV